MERGQRVGVGTSGSLGNARVRRVSSFIARAADFRRDHRRWLSGRDGCRSVGLASVPDGLTAIDCGPAPSARASRHSTRSATHGEAWDLVAVRGHRWPWTPRRPICPAHGFRSSPCPRRRKASFGRASRAHHYIDSGATIRQRLSSRSAAQADLDDGVQQPSMSALFAGLAPGARCWRWGWMAARSRSDRSTSYSPPGPSRRLDGVRCGRRGHARLQCPSGDPAMTENMPPRLATLRSDRRQPAGHQDHAESGLVSHHLRVASLAAVSGMVSVIGRIP